MGLFGAESQNLLGEPDQFQPVCVKVGISGGLRKVVQAAFRMHGGKGDVGHALPFTFPFVEHINARVRLKVVGVGFNLNAKAQIID